MGPIRIALGQMPRLLGDIVAQVIQREPDMQIVSEAADEAAIDELLQGSQADVVVLDDAMSAASAGKELLHKYRGLKVLMFFDNGRTADVHWLEPRVARCKDVSPDLLVGLIRQACGRRP